MLGAISTKLWLRHTDTTSRVGWGSGIGRYSVSTAGGRDVEGRAGIVEICDGGAERLTVFIKWIKIAGAGARTATLKTSKRNIGMGSIFVCCRGGSEGTNRSLRIYFHRHGRDD